jgi:hypothetical protein
MYVVYVVYIVCVMFLVYGVYVVALNLRESARGGDCSLKTRTAAI